MFRSLLPLIFCFVAAKVLPQDYVVVGDTLKQGKVRRAGNSKLAQGYDNNLVEYPMDKVSEYRQGSNVYQALVLDGDRRMYKRIANGKVAFYKRKHSYVLKSDDQLIALQKNNFRSMLAGSLTCEGKDPSMSKVVFSRASMQSVVEGSNAGSCNLDRIAYRKFGFMAGYSFIDLKASATQTIHSGSNVETLTPGLFFEGPLFVKFPWLYGSVEAFFQLPYKTEFVFIEPAQTTHMSPTISSLMITPGFKLTTNRGSVKPYLRLAPTISFTQFDAPNGLRVKGTARDGQLVSTVVPDSYPQFGISGAVGIQFQLNERKNIHLEVRHVSAGANSNSQFEISSKSTVALIGFSL